MARLGRRYLTVGARRVLPGVARVSLLLLLVLLLLLLLLMVICWLSSC